MGYGGKIISLNDEVIETPKIRKDQQRRVQNLVRSNSDHPIVALGLVRDYLKGVSFVKGIHFNNEENPTHIEVTCKSNLSGLTTKYTFRLKPYDTVETPTLD